jgi:hypothetical protein
VLDDELVMAMKIGSPVAKRNADDVRRPFCGSCQA